MDDLMKTTYGVCIAVVIIELLSQLSPYKFDGFVRGTAVLWISTALLFAFCRLGIEFNPRQWITETEEIAIQSQDYAVEYGIEILKSRLYTVLEAAGVSVSGQEKGITVLHSLDDTGNIEIEGVQVLLEYETDRDRTNALLQGILTQAIPLEVYVK